MFIDNIYNKKHSEEFFFEAIRSSGLPVILFGAGDMVCYILTYLRYNKIEPLYICDNNKEKQGRIYLGLPILSYDTFKKKSKEFGGKYNIVVSVGTEFRDSIFAQLEKENEQNKVFYLRGYELCGNKIDYQYVINNLTQFEEAYYSFADIYSQKVFINVLNAKLSGNFSLYTDIYSPTMYFDKDIIMLSDHEVFLDIGAYKGDAIVEFSKITNGQYDSIVAFEPDKNTLDILKNTIETNGIKKIELHNIGAWHKHTYLDFQDNRGESSRLSETDNILSTTSVQVDKIDSILKGNRITYIAMDVEGSEHNAILGSEQTIKKWKPKMAVCVYHKREDLFDILLLLKSFVPEYKFYLRHYTNNQTETVLYAI